MNRNNFLITLSIFIEDDLNEFDLKDIFKFLVENSIEFPNMFNGIYSYLLKERNQEKIRVNLLDNIPKIIVSSRLTITKLEEKPRINKDKIDEIKALIQLMLMIDNYLKSSKFRVFKVA